MIVPHLLSTSSLSAASPGELSVPQYSQRLQNTFPRLFQRSWWQRDALWVLRAEMFHRWREPASGRYQRIFLRQQLQECYFRILFSASSPILLDFLIGPGGSRAP